jgi:hypothetical protein
MILNFYSTAILFDYFFLILLMVYSFILFYLIYLMEYLIPLIIKNRRFTPSGKRLDKDNIRNFIKKKLKSFFTLSFLRKKTI